MFRHIGFGDQEGFGVAAIFSVWASETGTDPEYAGKKTKKSQNKKDTKREARVGTLHNRAP